MSVWDEYQARVHARGSTKRSMRFKREVRTIENRLPDNLSYCAVTVYDSAHGYNITTQAASAYAITKQVAIINTDNEEEKTIISMPGEDIEHGSLVLWMDNYWLVTERDANRTIYTKAKMIQCNYLLKWVAEDYTICEQWCIVEDGTKYLTGEYEDRNFIVTRGDSRLYMNIARNDKTMRFGRANRFIIDDEGSPVPMCYSLTKPLKVGSVYKGNGVYKFVLQEVQLTDDDNIHLRIADFHKYFPKQTEVDLWDPTVIDPEDIAEDTGRRKWL